MKKLFVLGITMSLAMATAVAQSTTVQPAKATKSTTAGPEITFAEKSHDFGKINQGDVVEYTFKFKNTGTAPLILSNVSTTCGCTVPTWPKEPIAPGKSGEITAKFNSAGKMGAQNKVVTIQSNAVGGDAQVSIITDVQEKPVAGAAIMKPTEAPSAATPAVANRPAIKTTTKVKAKTKK